MRLSTIKSLESIPASAAARSEQAASARSPLTAPSQSSGKLRSVANYDDQRTVNTSISKLIGLFDIAGG